MTIDQILIPAAIFEGGTINEANNAFDRLIPIGSKERDDLLGNVEMQNQLDRALNNKRAVNFEINLPKQSFRCTISPIASSPGQLLVYIQDISIETQGDIINALLYRLSLLLAATDETLSEKLQSAVDQILFEVYLFDCSIMLLNNLDGRLHTVAWGTTDKRSSISGKRSFAMGQGIAGRVAQSRKPLIIPNTRHDRRYIRKPGDTTELALICLPIVSGDELLGVMSISRPIDPGFNEKDLQLFATIVNRMCLVIKNQINQINEEKLTDLTQLISSSRGIFKDYAIITKSLGELLCADQCFILHWNKESKRIVLKRQDAEKSFPVAERTKVERLIKQTRNIRQLLDAPWVSLGEATLFPLNVRHQLAGFVYVKNTKWVRQLTNKELALGLSLSSQLAIALENAAYNEEVMNEQKKLQQIQDALHDGLLLYTVDMKVAMVNSAAKRLLGLKQDVTGLPWDRVLGKDMKKYCSYTLVRHFDPAVFLQAAIKQGKTSTGEATLMSKPPKTVEITVAPVYDRRDQLSGVLSHIRDITQVHELQQKMALRVEELTTLFKISSVTGLNTEQIIRRILRLVLPLLSVRAAELMLCDVATNQMSTSQIVGEYNLNEALRDRIYQKARSVLKNRKPVALKLSHGRNNATHVLIIPIVSEHENALGTLIVVDKKDRHYFSREDINLLSIVATQIATKLDNVSLMKQLGTDRDKLATIIDQSVDGILVVDNDQRIQIWNRALEKITGITEKMVRNKVVDDTSKMIERLEIQQHEDTIDVLIRHRVTGKLVWLSVDYSPITHQGETIGQIAIIRDISRQKELDKAQKEFVATASHELRSPITAIVGYLSMLRRGDAGQITNKEQALFVDKAYQNSKRMIGLIEDLLTTTRMEAGQVRYEKVPIALNELIESVLSDVSFKALDKGIALHCQRKDCGTVIGDHDGLQQVFTNLINNAINYTEPGGTVSIGFRTTTEKGKMYQIVKIKDTGVGIDAQDQEKIFDKFSRIDNVLSISAGGTGLGLYITKSIIEELDGKIWVESKKGQGATFYVKLPRVEARAKKGTP